MTFLPECGACISLDRIFFLLIKWVHNDFMYVRFAGMRNTKTWSNSTYLVEQEIQRLGASLS